MRPILTLVATATLIFGCCVAFAGETSAPMPESHGTSEMFGVWTVVKVFCVNCQGRKTPEIGTKIVVLADSFSDPFSTKCATGASYPNRRLAWQAAINLFKLSKDARALVSPETTITDARLNCDGGPYARVLFIGQDHAIYIYEGENYLLQRIKTQ
jgi:hypothetical protein